MAKLVAYLQFNGNCREAMNFYKECLGGELTLMTVGESQMAAHMPPAAHDRILHSMLANQKITLMGSDHMDGDGPTHGNSIALCLVGESKGEIEAAFAKLSQGANVTHPLIEEFFGTFGDLTDRYGFNWMFQYAPAP